MKDQVSGHQINGTFIFGGSAKLRPFTFMVHFFICMRARACAPVLLEQYLTQYVFAQAFGKKGHIAVPSRESVDILPEHQTSKRANGCIVLRGPRGSIERCR